MESGELSETLKMIYHPFIFAVSPRVRNVIPHSSRSVDVLKILRSGEEK